MKITKASVVIRSGCSDSVCLTTDLPSPYKCDNEANNPLILSFSCSRKTGEEYVKKHFNIEPEVIFVS